MYLLNMEWELWLDATKQNSGLTTNVGQHVKPILEAADLNLKYASIIFYLRRYHLNF